MEPAGAAAAAPGAGGTLRAGSNPGRIVARRTTMGVPVCPARAADRAVPSGSGSGGTEVADGLIVVLRDAPVAKWPGVASSSSDMTWRITPGATAALPGVLTAGLTSAASERSRRPPAAGAIGAVRPGNPAESEVCP